MCIQICLTRVDDKSVGDGEVWLSEFAVQNQGIFVDGHTACVEDNVACFAGREKGAGGAIHKLGNSVINSLCHEEGNTNIDHAHVVAGNVFDVFIAIVGGFTHDGTHGAFDVADVVLLCHFTESFVATGDEDVITIGKLFYGYFGERFTFVEVTDNFFWATLALGANLKYDGDRTLFRHGGKSVSR